jgi:hypothetical protein
MASTVTFSCSVLKLVNMHQCCGCFLIKMGEEQINIVVYTIFICYMKSLPFVLDVWLHLA